MSNSPQLLPLTSRTSCSQKAKGFTTIAEDLPKAARASYSLEPERRDFFLCYLKWGEKVTGTPKTRKLSLKAENHENEASTKRYSRFISHSETNEAGAKQFISHLGENAESGWADLFFKALP